MQRAREVGLRLENFEKSSGIEEQAPTYIHTYRALTVHTYSIDTFTSHTYIHIHLHTYPPTYIHIHLDSSYISTYIHTYISTYMHSGPRRAEPHHPEQQETGIPLRREATQPKQHIRQCRTHTYVHSFIHTYAISLTQLYVCRMCMWATARKYSRKVDSLVNCHFKKSLTGKTSSKRASSR